MGKAKESLKKKGKQIGEALDNALSWAVENPVKAGIIFTIGSKVVWESGRAMKRRQIAKIDLAKQLSVYDPTLDCKWELKRKMSNDEIKKFSELLDDGLSRGEALQKMKLLK